MTQLLHWTRQLLALTMVLFFMAWMWAEGAQWVLRWRAERLLADIKTLEVGRSSSADVQQFARSRPQWESSKCQTEECVYYSVHIAVFSPYTMAGRMLSLFSPNDDALQTKYEAVMGRLGLRPMFVDGFLLVEHESLSMREFMVLLPLSHEPHAVRSREVSHFETDSVVARDVGHPVLRWLRGSARGIMVEYEPTEDPATRARLMDFQFSCMTRLISCRSDADILPAARQMMIGEEKRAGGVH